MSNGATADEIYMAIFGDLDSAELYDRKTAEIEEWLDEGDPEDTPLAILIAEWRDNDAAEIADRIA